MPLGRLRLGRLLGLAVSAAALWLVVRSVDVGSAAVQIARADPRPLAAVLLVILTQLVLRTIRWRALLAVARPPSPLSISGLLPVLLVGYLGNAVLPARLGEPIRALLVARRAGLDAAAAFGTVVLERILDTASLAVLAFVACAASGAPGWLTQATGIVALGATAIAVLLAAGGAGLVVQALRRVGSVVPSPRVERALRIIELVAVGTDGAGRRRVVAGAALVSGACWALDATTFWLVGQALGISLAPAAALIIAAVTVLGTALPSAPGYVGTFELAAASTATLLGVSPSGALALAVLAHAMTVLPPALGGAAFLATSGLDLGTLSDAGEALGRVRAAESGG